MICWVLAMEMLQGVWKQHLRPRAVVGYGVKIFPPSPPNYVTRSPGLSWAWTTFVTKRNGIICLRYLFKIKASRRKENRPKEGVTFKRRLLFLFSEGSRKASLHVLELYNQVRERSCLFCIACSILKRVFTTFRTNFRPGGRIPSCSPFAYCHQKM